MTRLRWFLCAAAIFGIAASDATADDKPLADPARVRDWNEDLNELARVLSEKHKNAFFKIKKEQFEAAVAAVRAKIPELKDHQIIVEFLRLSAMIGDSHTTLGPGPNTRRFRYLPVGFVWLKEGLFIDVATKEHEDLVRMRVKRIGKSTPDEALQQIAPVYAASNSSGLRDQTRRSLTEVELLAGLGMIDDAEHIELTLEDSKGAEHMSRLTPMAPNSRPQLAYGFDPNSKDLAVSRRPRRELYGMEWLADSKTLYCWYDSCQNMPGKPVKDWCANVLARIDSQPPDRVVIDLRRNGGGNSVLAQPLINGLHDRPAVNQKGKLFVLIGPGTYSSAMQNAFSLRTQTHAVLLGLPTGGSPNHYGEIKFFELPHCKWLVQYSTKYFQATNDNADSVAPDISIEPTAADYFSGHDPVFNAAIKYKP